MNAQSLPPPPRAVLICPVRELDPGAGTGVLLGEAQVAVFYLPGETPPVRAIGNHDPVGGANVLARGIVGDIDGEPVVASPLYKQHYSLVTGACLEKPEHRVPVYGALVCDGWLYLMP